jgi:hypothetical protein
VYVCRVILEHNHELVPGLHGMKKKKSRAPRAKKVGTGQSQVPHSVVHEAGSSANLKSGEHFFLPVEKNENLT